MALIDPKTRRKMPIPHEPESWVELRPLTARDMAEIQRDSDGKTRAEVTLRILQLCLTDWSYEAAITEEALGSLDIETFNWLDLEAIITAGTRDDVEKKESELPSSPTTDPAADASPLNLVTSERSLGLKSKVS